MNFEEASFSYPDCFKNHPASKDGIKKVYTQEDLAEKGLFFAVNEKRISIQGGSQFFKGFYLSPR